jgi:hypothetical protein
MITSLRCELSEAISLKRRILFLPNAMHQCQVFLQYQGFNDHYRRLTPGIVMRFSPLVLGNCCRNAKEWEGELVCWLNLWRKTAAYIHGGRVLGRDASWTWDTPVTHVSHLWLTSNTGPTTEIEAVGFRMTLTVFSSCRTLWPHRQEIISPTVA